MYVLENIRVLRGPPHSAEAEEITEEWKSGERTEGSS